jgi:predicted NACHT family NTPase
LVSRKAFDSALSNGLCLLLFDGLDEIDGERSKRFERELEDFADKYPKNHFVISSRPYQAFGAFTRITVLKIKTFTKEQTIKLIERLDFRDDEPDIKKKFLINIQSGKYDAHQSFIESPLLLTIMLLTFERFADT